MGRAPRPIRAPKTAPKRRLARALAKVDPYKSGYERKFAAHLAARLAAGEILDWWYEPLRFRTAHGGNYTPDFLILHLDGTLEVVEVKGWEKNLRSSRNLFKAAAEINYWIRFTWATAAKGGGWNLEPYEAKVA